MADWNKPFNFVEDLDAVYEATKIYMGTEIKSKYYAEKQ